MKCIEFYKPNARIVRVADAEARATVAAGKARFVAKNAWKKARLIAPRAV